MPWSQLLSIAAMLALPFTSFAAHADAGITGVTAPATHDNLAVYFVRGTSAPGPVPLTLQEAISSGAVTVHETGDVNELVIENTGSEEVFVQAGDIVKGGRQDRVLAVSLSVPAKSGKVPIGAYCVEHGRWSARGKEDAHRFASADKALPSREAKLALLNPEQPRPVGTANAEPRRQSAERTRTPEQRQLGSFPMQSRQEEVWAHVRKIQSGLSASLNERVTSEVSASSLQLSLENEKVAFAKAAYLDALLEKGAGEPDIVGVVVAINGRVSSADVYPSNGLFRKMWPKLLEAAAVEAIGSKNAPSSPAPEADAVRGFIETAEAARPTSSPADPQLPVRRTVRDSDKSLLIEAERSDGTLIHRAYVAK